LPNFVTIWTSHVEMRKLTIMAVSGEFLTSSQAASELGVSPRTVYRLATPELPAFKAGRSWLFKAADVERLKERRSGASKVSGADDGVTDSGSDSDSDCND
jgi:excisionase family DNA binding protein